MQSITFRYLPGAAQRRIGGHMGAAGARARRAAPLAWLAFEPHEGLGPHLTLRLWPGDGEILLATADPHGWKVTWIRH